MFRWLTAGESHGPQLTVVIDGVPAGLELTAEDLRHDLRRRQGGHGRGERQKIEVDDAKIMAGVRGGVTIGSPIALVIENRDHVNWIAEMTPEREGFAPKPVTRLRPGHADLAGALKYNHSDVRNILERSSARETTSRVAAGGVARRLLARFGIRSIGIPPGGGAGEVAAVLDEESARKLRMIYLETPANPTNTLADIALFSSIARQYSTGDRRVLVAVDNAFLGPVWQHPLKHGADLVLY